MKKLIFIVFGLIAAISAFAGGNSAQGPAQSAATTPLEGGGPRRYPSLPFATDGKTSLTIFVGGIGGQVTTFDYPENTLTKKVVDDTGVMLNFVTSSMADATTRLNLLLNSGDYPDVITRYGTDFNKNAVEYYASQGIFIPLDNYDMLNYPNIKKAFAEYPVLFDLLQMSDGKMYSTPFVNDCIQCVYREGRGWYFMPWARDNSRKLPATLDEFTDYLRWIRDNDLNGNGDRNDEIPLTFEKGDLQNFIAYFAKSYMPWSNNGLMLYDGVVTEQYRLNEFREVLKYLAGLYKEGLIKEDSFTMTGEQLQTSLRSPAPVIGTYFKTWTNGPLDTSSQRFREVNVLPMLTGPNGQRWASNMTPVSQCNFGWFITDKCKNPELAIAMYDYMTNWWIACEDYGPKGIGWDDADPGSTGLGGGPARHKLLASRGTQKVNQTWNQFYPAINNSADRLAQQANNARVTIEWLHTGNPALLPQILNDPDYIEIMYTYLPTLQIQEGITIPLKYFIPPVTMSNTDSVRVGDINAVLNPYKDQAWVEFITGIRDPNSNAAWTAYLSDLDRINSREMVSIYQKYIK
jgi:putative aldouronate transport system substrate-binding protein